MCVHILIERSKYFAKHADIQVVTGVDSRGEAEKGLARLRTLGVSVICVYVCVCASGQGWMHAEILEGGFGIVGLEGVERFDLRVLLRDQRLGYRTCVR